MNILYGVPSEGMGHATRSKVVIAHLLAAGHDVRIATSDRAFELLEKAFPGRGFRIEGLHLRYDRGTVSKWGTFKELLSSAPRSLVANTEAFLELRKAAPIDLVISDFESFSYYFAKHRRLPLLSIDNMQVINRCELGFEVPDVERENYRLAKGIIKAKVPFCDRYLVTSFFPAAPRKERTVVVPPILRSEIVAARDASRRPSSPDAPVLVYQTASSQDDLVQGLRAIAGQRFVVYGLNRDEEHDNVVLKKFSEVGFIEDLCAAKAVVTNGGFSLISEAVYLHRPVCSFPLAGQFEQFVNGAEIDKLGYGRRFDGFSADAVRAFLHQLPEFASRIATYEQDGNRATLEAVDRFLDEVRDGRLVPSETEDG